MPILSRGRVDVLLTREATLTASRIRAVAPRVVRSIPSDDASGQYPEFSRADMMRDDAQRATARSVAPEITLAHTFRSYTVESHKLRVGLDEFTRSNSSAMISQFPEVATRLLTRKLTLRTERQFAATAFGSGFTNNVVGATDFTRWSDGASTPLTDIGNWRNLLRGGMGDLQQSDLIAIMGPDVFERLRLHPEIRALASGGNPSAAYTPNTLDEAKLAELLGVREVMVVAAHYIATVEGAATAPGIAVASNVFGLYYQPAPAELGELEPSAFKAFHWNAYDGSQEQIAIRRYREESTDTEFTEGKVAVTYQVAVPFGGVVATQVLTA